MNFMLQGENSMRHRFAIVLVVMYRLTCFAQDAPKAEIFAGYSYGNYELSAGAAPISISTSGISTTMVSPSARMGLSGWNSSATVDINRWFGFATDFSGYYSGSSVSVTQTETLTPCTGCGTETNTTVNTFASPKIHNFLFGPQFSYPAGKIRPFAQFLIGGEHVDVTRLVSATNSGGIIAIGTNILPGHISETGFAMALGGGLDYSIKRTLAWRIQADYLTSQAGLAQNHVRISTGLVWRVGN
jgi:hypothetical protein